MFICQVYVSVCFVYYFSFTFALKRSDILTDTDTLTFHLRLQIPRTLADPTGGTTKAGRVKL